MEAVELDDIGLINGANTFGTDILNGSQPIVYTQDIPTALSSGIKIICDYILD
jgi:hypothetical protein